MAYCRDEAYVLSSESLFRAKLDCVMRFAFRYCLVTVTLYIEIGESASIGDRPTTPTHPSTITEVLEATSAFVTRH